MKIAVQQICDKAPKKVGEISLDDKVFAVTPRVDILHRVVTWQMENRRSIARAARERSDVARTGKKFGRQKGGGTARHGDRRAPIFVGGGKAHGPRARIFAQSLNKKIRRLGLKMAMSDKLQANQLLVVDNLSLKDPKTKILHATLAKMNIGARALFIDGDAVDANFARAAANLPNVNVLPAIGANVYDILRADTLILTQGAVEKLEARCHG